MRRSRSSLPSFPHANSFSKRQSLPTVSRRDGPGGCSGSGRPTGGLSAEYPYPVQSWKLGDGPLWVILGGEVVVDYSLRFKNELGADTTWVAGYANDVMAYIPSLRVLREGGYEGARSMIYYGQPSPWAEGIETRIAAEVQRQAKVLTQPAVAP